MPDSTPAQAFGFGTPWEDQIAHLRNKLNLPTERWDDIMRSAHDRAFVVAGAQKADLLSDLHAAVVKAAEGGSLTGFRKDFKALVEKNGWTGWTGEGSKEGEAWRTKVIYQTNMSTSYAAGRYAQMTHPDSIEAMPYWRYIHADGILNPRQQHVAWHGLTLPHDHPFWTTHFPPCGWGCHCRVTGITKREGLASAKAGLGEPPAGWDKIDTATGEQPGIGKGWGYAPGASVSDELAKFVADKAAKLPTVLADALRADAKEVLQSSATSWQDFASAGGEITAALPSVTTPESALLFHDALLALMRTEGRIGSVVANVAGNGAGAKLVRKASELYPDKWVSAANSAGSLVVKGTPTGSRGFAVTLDKDYKAVKLNGFGTLRDVKAGQGFIAVPTNSPKTAVHEYAHRLQTTVPGLDALFQRLHVARTAGAPLKSLSDIYPNHGFSRAELTREDHYTHAYQGKEYKQYPDAPALEVMTMGLETVLGVRSMSHGSLARPLDDLLKMYTHDREMVDFVVGLLLKHG